MANFKPLSLEKVEGYPLKDRLSKVNMDAFAKAWQHGGSLNQWLQSLPKILACNDLKEIADGIVRASKAEKTVVLAMGAHPIKVGLNPIILDLLDRRIITGLAMNGAGIIHDAEIAMVGSTSEDVALSLGNGRFGMADETGNLLNTAIVEGIKTGLGLGQAVGAMLVKKNFPYNHHSLLAKACEMDIPVTIHVAIGTDTIHFHPNADGAAIGRGSHRDFRIFARMISTLEQGVFINLGSAVIMPEVFLKALSLVRNLGYEVKNFTTVNMDFIKHYRPITNVVNRPSLEGG
jgi:hypothetical protein